MSPKFCIKLARDPREGVGGREGERERERVDAKLGRTAQVAERSGIFDTHPVLKRERREDSDSKKNTSLLTCILLSLSVFAKILEM